MSRRRREDDYTIPENERARALRMGRPTLADHPLVKNRDAARARPRVVPWSRDRKVARKGRIDQ